jgi:hypothetical protein
VYGREQRNFRGFEMKKFALALVATTSMFVFGFTGCGRSGENTVIETTGTPTEMAPEQKNQYEEYMKNQQKGPGN